MHDLYYRVLKGIYRHPLCLSVCKVWNVVDKLSPTYRTICHGAEIWTFSLRTFHCILVLVYTSWTPGLAVSNVIPKGDASVISTSLVPEWENTVKPTEASALRVLKNSRSGNQRNYSCFYFEKLLFLSCLNAFLRHRHLPLNGCNLT